ncbi:MAG: hypothetical protein HQK72_05720 [Desulfamplus sp.]|nr:hypothetical protein [Desulfamplus sp.]
MKQIFYIALALIILSAPASGSDDIIINEGELFSNPTTVIDSETDKNQHIEDSNNQKQSLEAEQNRIHFGISGEIQHVTNWSIKQKNHLEYQKRSDINPYIDGVMFIDVRLPDNIKAFANIEAVYNTDNSNAEADYEMKELFVDFNINKAIYFRTGKQVLQWGRCYLFNPTDLINVEKKTFTEKIGSREGTRGIKAHIPFGTDMNMYGFINTTETDEYFKIDQFQKISGAYKIEFLVENTEMAFSIWGKEDAHTVYGYDFSTKILGIDIQGELSASYGDNTDKLVEQNGTLYAIKEEDKWITKAAIDLGKAFDFNEQPDKIQVNLELFYNGAGYEENVFEDNNIYMFDSPVAITSEFGINQASEINVPAGLKSLYLIGNGLYEPNYYSPYYAAIFTTVNKFFTSDFSLKANLISNIKQDSFIFTTGIDYQNINDFNAGISINRYFGATDSEYTFLKNAFDVIITFGLTF